MMTRFPGRTGRAVPAWIEERVRWIRAEREPQILSVFLVASHLMTAACAGYLWFIEPALYYVRP